MDKNKQIEEMKRDIKTALSRPCSAGRCLTCEFINEDNCEPPIIADHLYHAGYRKASEVALEVINTALSKIQIMISAIKAQEESGNVTEFNGGARTALKIVFKDITELKKKYTEGEG